MSSPDPKATATDPATPGAPQPDVHELHNVMELHAPILREKAEPRDGFEPIPPWTAIFFGALLFWGGYYLASYNGDFRADVYDENWRGGAAGQEKKPVDPLALGKRLYTANCVACHQPTGEGQTGQFPPLNGSKLATGSPARLVRILLHGLQGPVVVRGTTYNGNMPAFADKLNDEQLALLLTYVRQEWSNQAGPISPDMVAAARKATAERRSPWTAAELETIVREDPVPEAPGTKDDAKDKGGKKKDTKGPGS